MTPAIKESAERPISPRDLSFEAVNDFVHDTDRHFEELQWLCLSLAAALDKASVAREEDTGPVDEAWLRSIGFIEASEECAVPVVFTMPFFVGNTPSALWAHIDLEEMDICVGSKPLMVNPSRSQVLSLLKALGMEGSK